MRLFVVDIIVVKMLILSNVVSYVGNILIKRVGMVLLLLVFGVLRIFFRMVCVNILFNLMVGKIMFIMNMICINCYFCVEFLSV